MIYFKVTLQNPVWDITAVDKQELAETSIRIRKLLYGSGHEGVAVLLPGFAIIW